jgi:hypothetical protein
VRRLSTLALAVAAALASPGFGCGPSAEAQEAARVLRAIDALRDATAEPLSAREGLVADLERQEAKSEKAARARDACAKAYRLLNEGKSLQARVEKALATPGSSGLDTLRDLGAAEAKIKESASAMPDCDSASSALRLGQGRGQ